VITNCQQRQIVEEIERVQAQLESVALRLRQGISWGSDEADQANDLVERAKAFALYQYLLQKRQQLERARARLDLGLDSACEVCGQLIDAGRLKIVVGATRCVDCQRCVEQRAYKHHRCVFGTRISPPFQSAVG
jgi:RNA polymerase-binding transcription factor DksA